MAEIVNLRQARKRRARDDKARKAAENRAAHGRSRAERERLAAETERQARHLAGHRRDDAAKER
ncbi:DUF4169 family protein [Aquibium sp. A9E412]|uniref:DUF4169 family protein n=1 Tax=Aquibium sp. A9E412 TaxID=2976767 RepID=UPI0025B10A77|nr:DUF4169 family protein [Aquibium sp. A9E412]MDN2566160.1 DUF4169 family protein [Aquibium sp. A9E412]